LPCIKASNPRREVIVQTSSTWACQNMIRECLGTFDVACAKARFDIGVGFEQNCCRWIGVARGL